MTKESRLRLGVVTARNSFITLDHLQVEGHLNFPNIWRVPYCLESECIR